MDYKEDAPPFTNHRVKNRHHWDDMGLSTWPSPSREESKEEKEARHQSELRRHQSELIRLKKLEEDKKRILEAMKAADEARLDAQQEQFIKRREQTEQQRIKLQRLAQQNNQQEEVRLERLRQKQKMKLQKEQLDAQNGFLLKLEDAQTQMRGLNAFFPPSETGNMLFRQRLEVLLIGCSKQLNNSFQQRDEQIWTDIMAQLNNMKDALP